MCSSHVINRQTVRIIGVADEEIGAMEKRQH